MKKLVFLLLLFVGFKASAQENLPYLFRPASDSNQSTQLLLLLHGYGSNEQDLFELAEKFPPNYVVVAPRAPLTVSKNGYAWFSISMQNGQRIANIDQATAAKDTLASFIQFLHTKHNFDSNNVVVFGFSQGGILAYSLALTEPKNYAGIAVMSGRLLEEIQPSIVETNDLKKLNVFVSHGKTDAVIAYEKAVSAVNFCTTLGIHAQLHTYDAGHTITPAMLNDVLAWMKEIKKP